MLSISIPLNVEVRATCSSTFTVETIDRRLEALSGREDADAIHEREYLLRLRKKKLDLDREPITADKL